MPTSYRSNLAEITRELRREVSKAVKEGAEDVSQAAKLRAPFETGALKAAIHTERRGMAEYAVVAGNEEAWYGHLVEHGTVSGGKPGGRGERPPTPPRPFLVPALESNRAKILARVEAALQEAARSG